VAGVLAVVDREEGGKEMLEAGGYQVVVLTTTSKLKRG
jgi:orotate phosphoribosyltransferase